MEAQAAARRESVDAKMANALAAGHDISSSEDEEEENFAAPLGTSDVPTASTVDEFPDVPVTPKSEHLLKVTTAAGKGYFHGNQHGERDIDIGGASKSGTDKMDSTTSSPGGSSFRRFPEFFKDFKKKKKAEQESSNLPPSKKRKLEDHQATFQEVMKEASPFNFLLTKVTGIPAEFNNKLSVHIKDILSVEMGELVESAQFNFMHDIPWLMEQYPAEHRSKPLLIVHGEERQGKVTLHEGAQNFPNITMCQAKLDMIYGTHHSKMMLLLYNNGLRVVIHTANLIEQDWYQKTQGVWISPLFPKLDKSQMSSDKITGDSITHFKKDLVEYLAMYKSFSLLRWKQHILQHDFTGAKVFLVASVPGRHTGESKNKWGHMKVRKVLGKQGPQASFVKNWSVAGQFSSVGSLGADQSKYLCGEWLQSMLSAKGVGTLYAAKDVTIKTLKLIFPSKENVRTSLEGYPAGASIPYNIQNARKQQYFHAFLHKWKADKRGRSRASPHIKTYALLSPDSKNAAWFMVTSANMSKAAWGTLEKNGNQLMIRSYEIGVMFLPEYFVDGGEQFSLVEDQSTEATPYFPIPWDVPLEPYTKADRPWVWDIPYTDKPDSHGNAWIPGGR